MSLVSGRRTEFLWESALSDYAQQAPITSINPPLRHLIKQCSIKFELFNKSRHQRSSKTIQPMARICSTLLFASGIPRSACCIFGWLCGIESGKPTPKMDVARKLSPKHNVVEVPSTLFVCQLDSSTLLLKCARGCARYVNRLLLLPLWPCGVLPLKDNDINDNHSTNFCF